MLSVGSASLGAASGARLSDRYRVSVVPLNTVAAPASPRSEDDVESLRQAVAREPNLRQPRFALTQALWRAGRLDEALEATKDWRAHDAYSLLVVRQLGDLYQALGQTREARRTYSSIVELLPRDVEARRGLATLLKAASDFAGAKRQLQEALELREDDRRIAFELADVEERMGDGEAARARFEAILRDENIRPELRPPTEHRLARLYAEGRRKALLDGDAARASALQAAQEKLQPPGGVGHPLKVYLSWDTDHTDVDLHIKTPSGEVIYYGHRTGASGERLQDDITNGYGPEVFSASVLRRGDYVISVDYFSSQGAIKEARGEVSLVLDEGKPSQVRQEFSYRIAEATQRVDVARIHVEEER